MKPIVNILIVVVVSAIFIRLFVLDSFIVKGDSMAPAILAGDYVFINKLAYNKFVGREPHRAEIIVAEPRGIDKEIIKRVIALPEERIQFESGKIVIKNSREDSGIELVESYLDLYGTPPIRQTELNIDPFEYFVLGDNRYGSTDSRELGPIDRWSIKGKVFFVFRIKSLAWKFL